MARSTLDLLESRDSRENAEVFFGESRDNKPAVNDGKLACDTNNAAE